jgi:hypothetical protein
LLPDQSEGERGGWEEFKPGTLNFKPLVYFPHELTPGPSLLRKEGCCPGIRYNSSVLIIVVWWQPGKGANRYCFLERENRKMNDPVGVLQPASLYVSSGRRKSIKIVNCSLIIANCKKRFSFPASFSLVTFFWRSKRK